MTVDRHRGMESEPRRIRLRWGRWYALTLRDGTVIVLQAFNTDPGRDPWVLAEAGESCPDDEPCDFIVGRDGTLEPDDETAERAARVIEEGLTAFDLVPADALAQAAWIATIGPYRVCPRCGGSDDRFHHPLCHTAGGIPLFPTFGLSEWSLELWDEFTGWEGEIASGPGPR